MRTTRPATAACFRGLRSAIEGSLATGGVRLRCVQSGWELDCELYAFSEVQPVPATFISRRDSAICFHLLSCRLVLLFFFDLSVFLMFAMDTSPETCGCRHSASPKMDMMVSQNGLMSPFCEH
jgi:hypothetical protein